MFPKLLRGATASLVYGNSFVGVLMRKTYTWRNSDRGADSGWMREASHPTTAGPTSHDNLTQSLFALTVQHLTRYRRPDQDHQVPSRVQKGHPVRRLRLGGQNEHESALYRVLEPANLLGGA